MTRILFYHIKHKYKNNSRRLFKRLDPGIPGVAAADYVSTSSSLPMVHPFQTLLLSSANKIAHVDCGRSPVMCDSMRAPRASATCERHVRAPRASATCERHVRAPRASATCERHVRAPRASATCERHVRAPRASATCERHVRAPHDARVWDVGTINGIHKTTQSLVLLRGGSEIVY